MTYHAPDQSGAQSRDLSEHVTWLTIYSLIGLVLYDST